MGLLHVALVACKDAPRSRPDFALGMCFDNHCPALRPARSAAVFRDYQFDALTTMEEREAARERVQGGCDMCEAVFVCEPTTSGLQILARHTDECPVLLASRSPAGAGRRQGPLDAPDAHPRLWKAASPEKCRTAVPRTGRMRYTERVRYRQVENRLPMTKRGHRC